MKMKKYIKELLDKGFSDKYVISATWCLYSKYHSLTEISNSVTNLQEANKTLNLKGE